MNKFMIIGNVGGDAELRYTPQGIAVANFSVGVNKTTGSGENKKQETTWVKCTVWREKAETAAKYITKGMKIMCEGEAKVSAYLDKQGKPAASLENTVFNFEFLSSKNENSAGGHTSTDDSYGGDPNEDLGDIPF